MDLSLWHLLGWGYSLHVAAGRPYVIMRLAGYSWLSTLLFVVYHLLQNVRCPPLLPDTGAILPSYCLAQSWAMARGPSVTCNVT